VDQPLDPNSTPDVQATINEILARISSGEITAQRGAALIEIAKKRSFRLAADAAPTVRPGRAHWVKVRVRAEGRRFSLPIPLCLLSLGVRIAGRYIPADSGLSPEMIRDAVKLVSAQKIGKVIEVHDSDADVEVWLY
jgi:hypothetical protein